MFELYGKEEFTPKLRSGELRVRNTKPACPPTFRYYLIPPISKKKKGKRDKKDHTGNIHSFRKQFYVTYKWKKKKRGWVGWVTQYKFPRINISPLSSDLPSLSKPPVTPTRPCIITVLDLSAQHLLWPQSELQECWAKRLGRESLQGEEGFYMWRLCGRSDEPPFYKLLSTVCGGVGPDSGC